MTAHNAKQWAQSVKTKRKVEEKIDVLAQSIAYLAEAIQNIEAEIETIKRSLG
jgi:hypothetical protein